MAYQNRSIDSILAALMQRIPQTYHTELQAQFDTLLQLGLNTLSELIDLLPQNDTPPTVKQTICWLLGQLNDQTFTPILIACLDDHSPDVRMQAAIGLGQLRSQDSVPRLIKVALNDGVLSVRLGAINALGFIGGKQAVPPLKERLADSQENAELRGHAAEALGYIGDKTAIPDLIAALSDSSPEVRFWAVFALSEFDDPRVIPAIERLSHDHSEIAGWGKISDEVARMIAQLRP